VIEVRVSLEGDEEGAMPKKVAMPKRGAALKKTAAKKAPAAKKAALEEDEVVEKKAGSRKAASRRVDVEMDEPEPIEEEAAPVAKGGARGRKPPVEDEMDFMDDMPDEVPARKSAAPKSKAGSAKLVGLLNESLGWELRAQAMYAHYAAYVRGLESLTLAEHFEEEVTESLGHAKRVRDIIATLGGEAITTRDATEIVHTEDTRVMLEEALKTEAAAAEAYRRIIPLVKDHPVFFHAIYHIHKDETAAVIEVETLLGH